MNSMIRQHHLRIPDVKAFLRTFERTKPLSPDDWASKESHLYGPGYLIFCLEPVAAPAGLSSFSKRGEEQGETFRVQNLCVVISKEEDNKCVAVNVSPSAYEFRVLDTLLLEKAMKAILDGRDFNYLAARPVQKLSPDDTKALFKLGSEYAKGGSRRALAVEGAALAEPAVALLNQLGAKVAIQVGKQLIDVGSICHMIFTPEGRQEDKSKSLLKSCFVPVRGDDESAAAPVQSQSFGEQPLYSIDPMADAARAADSYSSEAGNIDLSSLAPEPLQSANLGAQGQAFAEAPGEPSSSFGDFGMGLLSALAPQQPANPPQAMSFESLNEGGRSPELPNLPFGSAMPTTSSPAANSMDTLPPTSPGASFSGMAAAGLSSMDNPPVSGSTTSHTGLQSLQTQMQAQEQPQAQAQTPPLPAPLSSPAPVNTQANPTASQTRLSEMQPRTAGGNGQAYGVAADWFIMAHEAIQSQASMSAAEPPAPVQAPAPAPVQAPAPAPVQAPAPAPVQAPAPDQLPASGPSPTTPEAMAAAESAVPREDFSKQFLSDWQQGHAGSAAVSAAEQELENEKKLKAEREKGKEQRLRDYFGEEHFQKYVKGEISEPDMAKVDAWQLDHSQYKSEPAEEGPNFDSDIFANAARSTLETNPEAMLLDPPREEITGPPPDPSWAIPAILAPDTAKSKPPSFDSMLPAGGELGAPEKVRPLDEPQAEGAPCEVPNLSILDALHQQEGQSANSAAGELPPLHPPEDVPAPSESLFTRLTGELSKPAENTTPEASTSQSNLPAMPAESPVAPPPAPAPVTINWAPPAESHSIVSSGDMWPIPASESLFSAPEEAPAPADSKQQFASHTSETAEPLATLPPTSYESAPAQAIEPPTAQVPESSSTAVTAVNESLAESLDAAIEAAVGTASEQNLDSVLGSSVPSSNDVTESLAAESQDFLSASQQQAEIAAPAETLPETKTAATAENAAENAAEIASEITEASSQTDVQQPRVRPRDYSSPLRAPKNLGASDSITPITPHQAVNHQNVSAPLQSSPTAAQPAAAAGGQDTRLMMNEMASLMSKLEMQVAKAANKMASRSEELRSRLSQQVDIVVKEAQDVEKQAEINLSTLASELKTKLDSLATEVQNSLVKDCQNAQLSVEEIAQNGFDKLESEQKSLSAEITRSAQDFRLELDRLTNTVNSRLDRLIESRNKELISLSDSILVQLKESHDAYNVKVSQRFDRFEQRMNEETSSISGSLERNMRSMVDEIETSLERACEKLKNTKFELEQTVAHAVAVAETSIAQKAKHVLTDTLLPRLNEQKEIIRTMIADMAKQVSSESNGSLDLELAKLDQGRARATQNLKKIADECVDELEMMGRSIKTGLEDHFKRVSNDLMVRTREVGDRIRETERRMADSEYALKGLAESSTVDSEPELAEERNHAVSKLASLKMEASKVLASTIEQNLDNLDSKGEQLSTELSNKRSELTAHVRESAETNITKIRQALQEATSSIQSAREKYME